MRGVSLVCRRGRGAPVEPRQASPLCQRARAWKVWGGELQVLERHCGPSQRVSAELRGDEVSVDREEATTVVGDLHQYVPNA